MIIVGTVLVLSILGVILTHRICILSHLRSRISIQLVHRMILIKNQDLLDIHLPKNLIHSLMNNMNLQHIHLQCLSHTPLFHNQAITIHIMLLPKKQELLLICVILILKKNFPISVSTAIVQFVQNAPSMAHIVNIRFKQHVKQLKP